MALEYMLSWSFLINSIRISTIHKFFNSWLAVLGTHFVSVCLKDKKWTQTDTKGSRPKKQDQKSIDLAS